MCLPALSISPSIRLYLDLDLSVLSRFGMPSVAASMEAVGLTVVQRRSNEIVYGAEMNKKRR